MSMLLELAERCEKATGPDRDLADDVLRACGFTEERRARTKGGHRLSWRLPDGRHVPISFDPTVSLDAAKALRRAALPQVIGDASTSALAICAATLRAMAAMESK